MTLYGIDKQGRDLRLGQGKIRTRFRCSTRQPELLRPGKICEYTLDLWHTGITIPAGSRLQIAVASAVFLLFSRNLNTGGHNQTETRYIAAKQAIYHDAKHPSHILLPRIAESGRPAPGLIAGGAPLRPQRASGRRRGRWQEHIYRFKPPSGATAGRLQLDVDWQ